MTIFRPRPILALCGAACLIAVTPYAPRSPGELGSRSPAARPALSFSRRQRAHTTAGDEQSAKWSVAAPLTFSEAHPVDLAPTASAAIGFVRAPPAAEAQSDANLAAQFAYADIPEAPPRAVGLGSAPFGPAIAPAPFAPPPPPRGSAAAVLYNKGDAAGLAALAKAADDSAAAIGAGMGVVARGRASVPCIARRLL